MNTLAEELTTFTAGQPATFRNLTLIPLLRPRTTPQPAYLLSDDAIFQGLARVTEVGGGGSVPELRLENRADQPVLLLDGEELVGAKQNRVLNLTILAEARTTIVIPVSCVEAGRWEMQSEEFSPVNHFMYSRGRAARARHVTNSMLAHGTRRSDQSAVWADIAGKAARMDAQSPTHRMSAAFERHALVLEEYVRAFSPQPDQSGVIFISGGATAGLDIFDHPATMRHLFPKLVRSYALDALDVVPGNGETKLDAQSLLSLVSSAPTCTDRAVGLGKDVRIMGSTVSGGALWAQDRFIHICAFVANGNPLKGAFQTRMRRPSRRHRSEGSEEKQ